MCLVHHRSLQDLKCLARVSVCVCIDHVAEGGCIVICCSALCFSPNRGAGSLINLVAGCRGNDAPHDAGSYNSAAWETGFFVSQGGNWDSDYGHFFLSWYSGLLLQHADRVLEVASEALNKRGRPCKLKRQRQVRGRTARSEQGSRQPPRPPCTSPDSPAPWRGCCCTTAVVTNLASLYEHHSSPHGHAAEVSCSVRGRAPEQMISHSRLHQGFPPVCIVPAGPRWRAGVCL